MINEVITMLNLDYAEFYITNVCNLNCDRCNRFNNYAFGGHQSWQAHADIYSQWSHKLSLNRIGILGGEPMLHPEFVQWVTQIATLWPRSQVMIMTNGTQLSRHPDLYNLLASYRGRVRMDINRHNVAAQSCTLQHIESLYPHGFDKFILNCEETFVRTGVHGVHEQHYGSMNSSPIDADKIGPEIWKDKSYQVVYRDRSGVIIRYATADWFDESVVRLDADQHRLYLTHDLSDPESAVSVCGGKYSHHFLQGKLYKCGVTAVLPQFLQQFVVTVPQSKLDLLSGYEPAEVTWDDHKLQFFLDNLSQGKSVPQCAVCSSTPCSQNFAATNKKIKIQKVTHGQIQHEP